MQVGPEVTPEPKQTEGYDGTAINRNQQLISSRIKNPSCANTLETPLGSDPNLQTRFCCPRTVRFRGAAAYLHATLQDVGDGAKVSGVPLKFWKPRQAIDLME